MKFELTVEQVNIVLAALAKQPLEAVLDVFTTIKSQAEAQMQQQSGEE